jgi:hypothetical protein
MKRKDLELLQDLRLALVDVRNSLRLENGEDDGNVSALNLAIASVDGLEKRGKKTLGRPKVKTSEPLMFSLDGGKTWQTPPESEVRLSYGDVTRFKKGELLINATDEGLIMDVLDGKGESVGTSSEMASEIVSRLDTE